MKYKKEFNAQLKDLKKYAVSDWEIKHGTHTKITFIALADCGTRTKCRFIMGRTPSDTNWVKQFERQKRRYLVERNISPK